MTKVDIVSGFLGAGKTTLIKKLLKDALHDTKVVLIENEFGEIGIDGGFLKEAGIQIREMNSGCICCSLVGDFGASLKEVMAQYAPERILIEPSGVGKLSDVSRAVKNAAEGTDMVFGSAVTVVDAARAGMYIKNFGEFFTDQISYAGTILLTRTEKCSEEKLQKVMEMIRRLNPDATVITTPLEELDGKMVMETIEGRGDLQRQLLQDVFDEEFDDDEEEEKEEHAEPEIDKDGNKVYHSHH
ncbi:MAG: GTP-binding protein, partial [Lachnospiraceae bacterium]|nr:GTP-binding protein [Lachnospiraceae bacterium]